MNAVATADGEIDNGKADQSSDKKALNEGEQDQWSRSDLSKHAPEDIFLVLAETSL